MDEPIIGKLQVRIPDGYLGQRDIVSIYQEVSQSQYDAVLHGALDKSLPLVIYTAENQQTIIPVRVLQESIIILNFLPIAEKQLTSKVKEGE